MNWFNDSRANSEMLVLEMVEILRREMPRIGTRKLHYLLESFYEEHEIKMGRDSLHQLLLNHDLIIQRKKRYVQTTNSRHWLRKYPNLIVNLKVTKPCQLWVSDITYISTVEGFCYLSLVTDGYSRKIVGYCLYPTLESEGCIRALNMALECKETEYEHFHHSDRGLQYCSSSYVRILKESGIEISMTEKGSPYENAIAERVNGILKSEFGLDMLFDDYSTAKAKVDNVITIYNSKRPHASCNYLTPDEAHNKKGVLKKRWKTPVYD